MKFTTALSLFPLFTAISASPVNTLSARAITFADFSNFSVACSSTNCSYSTSILLSDSTSFTCMHSTAGATVPAVSGFWTCTAGSLLLRFNKLPAPTLSYRIVLTDARVPGSSVTLDYLSPAAQWPGDAAYTGPTSFRAD